MKEPGNISGVARVSFPKSQTQCKLYYIREEEGNYSQIGSIPISVPVETYDTVKHRIQLSDTNLLFTVIEASTPGREYGSANITEDNTRF